MSFHDRLAYELLLQQENSHDLDGYDHPSKNYHMLGTQVRKKYMEYLHIDFFFQHLQQRKDGERLTFYMLEQPKRAPKIIDLWIYMFRHGFELRHKCPSGEYFVYNWQYLDW